MSKDKSVTIETEETAATTDKKSVKNWMSAKQEAVVATLDNNPVKATVASVVVAHQLSTRVVNPLAEKVANLAGSSFGKASTGAVETAVEDEAAAAAAGGVLDAAAAMLGGAFDGVIG